MDAALLFWEKYFNNQVETTWDDFSHSFSQFLLQYGQIILDEKQLLFIKSIIDPDYRNIIKIGDYLIFYEIYWKTQSKRQALFKHQFTISPFIIPKQILKGLMLKVLAISSGYQAELDSIIMTRTHINSNLLKEEEILSIGSSEQCDYNIQNDLQVNPLHCKFIWTPYNIFLIRDMAKSFRTQIRITEMMLDAYMVIKLSQNSVFKVKFIEPVPKLYNQISTYQDSLQNQLPDLLKEYQKYTSVQQFREREINLIEHNSKPQLNIEFIEGPLKGQEFLLNDNSYTIGNGKQCAIHIPDANLQREHCIIKLKNNNWIISHHEQEFLDQTQFGTFVLLANSNQLEQCLPSKIHPLHEGSKIIIGPMLYQMDLELPLPSFRDSTRSNHIFGPTAYSKQLQQKSSDLEVNKQELRVQFKSEDNIFIVENWKNYNIDVSVSAMNTKSKSQQTACGDVCSIQ